MSDAEFENKLVDQVVSDVKVEIPECMIIERSKELLNEFATQLSQQGIQINDFMRYTGESADKMMQTFFPRAEQQVKSRLAMEAVAVAEKIEISAEQLEEKYKELAEQYKIDVEKLKGFFPEKELVRDLLCNKAIDLIKESAIVLDTDPDADKGAEKEKKAKPASKSAKKEDKPAKSKAAAKTDKSEEEKPKKAKKTAKTEQE